MAEKQNFSIHCMCVCVCAVRIQYSGYVLVVTYITKINNGRCHKFEPGRMNLLVGQSFTLPYIAIQWNEEPRMMLTRYRHSCFLVKRHYGLLYLVSHLSVGHLQAL